MTQSDYGIVGMSSAFEDRRLFTDRLKSYLGHAETKIIAVNDVLGLGNELFKDRILDSISPAMPLRAKRDLVRDSKFAVFFWDGTSISDFVYLARLYGVPTRVVAVETTRVVNKDRGDEFDVYIGRGTPWGNPFEIGDKGADRSSVIEMYREYFHNKFVEDPDWNREIKKLKGKVLACHCKPRACHGDVIAKYLNGLTD